MYRVTGGVVPTRVKDSYSFTVQSDLRLGAINCSRLSATANNHVRLGAAAASRVRLGAAAASRVRLGGASCS